MSTKVSIVMPIYNAAEYLKECLDTVVHQTLKDIEIICVNDGSKDNSLEILNKYADKDKRIKIISKPNSGYGHTMNVGMAAATGEYIGIVEPDDFVDRHMYKDLYKIAKKFDLDVVKSDRYEFQTQNGKRQRYIRTVYDPIYYDKVLSAYELEEAFLFAMNTWTGIYKTSFLRENGIRHNETPGASYQDNGFFFQTIALAKSVYFVNKAYYHYRTDNPNSSINNKEKVFCICDEYDFIRKFVCDHSEVAERFMKMYQIKRYHNYSFTYDRVADEYKFVFLKKFADDFKNDYEDGVLDLNWFETNDKDRISKIIDDYQQVGYEDAVYRIRAKYTELRNRCNCIRRQLAIINKDTSNKKYQNIKPISEKEFVMTHITEDRFDKVINLYKNEIKALEEELENLAKEPNYGKAVSKFTMLKNMYRKGRTIIKENGLKYTLKKTISKLSNL